MAAVAPLLRSRDPDMVEQGIELVRAYGPALRDAALRLSGLSHQVVVSLALRCGGACPPWVRLELPLHLDDLDRLREHPEVTSLTLSLWGDDDGLVVPPLKHLSIRGRYTGIWNLSLSGPLPPALSSISISSARLETVTALPALRDIELRSCPGDALAPLLSPELRRLVVTASSEPLLPVSLAMMPGLEQLHLEDVGLEAVPEGIEALERLELLNLSNNQIRALPDAIGRLPELRELVLSNNPLSELPASVGRLQALKTLRLAACPLRELPPEVGMLGALQKLSLRHTLLAALPEGMSLLPELEILDLSGTQIPALPPGGLPVLRTLTFRKAALDLERGGPLPLLRQLYTGSAGEAAARAWIAADPGRASVEIRA